MRTRLVRSVWALVIALLLGFAAAAQTPAPPAPTSPSRLPEEQSAPSIAGRWKMTVNVESADRVSTLDLKQEGAKVSGTCTPPSGEFAVTGEWVDGKLSFTMDYQNLKLVFTGTLKEDGTLAGTMDYGRGPNDWKAERIKEK